MRGVARGTEDGAGVTTVNEVNEWIEWHGGKCPVPTYATVEVKLRDDIVCPPERADAYYWDHRGDESYADIVAYRWPLGDTKGLTGGSSDYYKVEVKNPTRSRDAYVAECNDIIEALGMNFAEGNVLKAVWRHAANRMGRGKPGNSLLYDAEKIEFFGKRMVEMDTHAI